MSEAGINLSDATDGSLHLLQALALSLGATVYDEGWGIEVDWSDPYYADGTGERPQRAQ